MIYKNATNNKTIFFIIIPPLQARFVRSKASFLFFFVKKRIYKSIYRIINYI